MQGFLLTSNLYLSLRAIYRIFTGVLLVLSTIPTYVLLLTPAREHIESAVLTLLPAMHTNVETIFMNSLRGGLGSIFFIFYMLIPFPWVQTISAVLVTAYLALRDPLFGSALGAVGGLTDAFQSFILPTVIFFASLLFVILLFSVIKMLRVGYFFHGE